MRQATRFVAIFAILSANVVITQHQEGVCDASDIPAHCDMGNDRREEPQQPQLNGTCISPSQPMCGGLMVMDVMPSFFRAGETINHLSMLAEFNAINNDCDNFSMLIISKRLRYKNGCAEYLMVYHRGVLNRFCGTSVLWCNHQHDHMPFRHQETLNISDSFTQQVSKALTKLNITKMKKEAFASDTHRCVNSVEFEYV